MLNKVLLIGNLTRDVELRYTPSGSAVCKLGLATNRKWKDKISNETKEEAMFIDVSLFGRTAEIANQYLKKGSKVFIEGRLQLERWTDQNGQTRTRHSVVAENMQFVDNKNSGAADDGSYSDDYSGADQGQSFSKSQERQKPRSNAPENSSFEDDEIPF